MSYADKVFVEMCSGIINKGVSTEGEKVRPVWEDTGEKAYTIKNFCVVNRYDLSKEFPAITLRKVPIKSCTDELLWIWQKKSNCLEDLDSTVWDEWADEYNTIGSAYGYQLNRKYEWKDVTREGLEKAFPKERGYYWKLNSLVNDNRFTGDNGGNNYHVAVDCGDYFLMDQVDKVIYDLVNTPFSRRIMTNMYNFDDLSDMALYPCAYSMTFNVTTDEEGSLVLNGILNQRSQDVLASNAWNVCQYAVLIHMLARTVNMKVGELVHVISDCHVYDRHVDIIKELINREQYEAPRFWLNPDKNDFYEFDSSDVKLMDYVHGEQVKDIPIAV